MHRFITRVCAAAAAGAVLSTMGVAGASASARAFRASQAVRASSWGMPHAPAGSGAQLWVKRYNGPGNSNEIAHSVAVSPSGSTVFVAGQSHGNSSGDDYETIAYNATTGAQVWAKRYTGAGDNSDVAYSVAVSPSGKTVFVTGESFSANSNYDYATVAYNAATGTQLWVKRYNGPGNYVDQAFSMAVTSSAVFVTGYSTGAFSPDYATVAYNATTGAQLWVKRYSGPDYNTDQGNSVAASLDGTKVFVTGYSHGTNTYNDYVTVAYNATTGAQLWAKRYSGPGANWDVANSVAVSPNGSAVFVTGYSHSDTTFNDYATVAYDAATGARLWVKRYTGPGYNDDQALSAAVSPTSKTVFVTGFSTGPNSSEDYATIAYNAATGAQMWVKRYNGPFNNIDVATSITVSPTGSKVYVTGSSYGVDTGQDYATVAYNAATGGQAWAKRYNGAANGYDQAYSVAVSPSGSTVFVTGSSDSSHSGKDYATVAYRG